MLQSRATVSVGSGVVASSHELASFHGARVLSEGGNVVDAAIATSAMLCVTQNNLCGLGGDLFALIRLGGKVLNLNGSGRASEKATIDFYRKEKKLEEIPQRGPLAAPTVPGIVHAWGELHSKFGTIDLRKLLAPAIHCARVGFPITSNYSNSIRASAGFLGKYSQWADIFLPGGKVPETGSQLRQTDLANSLEAIASDGTSTFYHGNLAEKIVRGIEKQGGLITQSDLKRHTSTWTEPVHTNYRGLDVYETAPNSQAATVILWLNMLEQYDLANDYELNSPEFLEIMIDTCLRSYSERSRQIADPEFHKIAPDFASKQFAKRLLASEWKTSKIVGRRKEHVGDTTYFAVGNSEGDCLSVIQSNYMGFGSGLVPEGTGLVIHNRGCYFTLDEKHHNSLKPGKRTFHTLCASIGVSGSQRTKFAIGAMGGDIQPQVHVQLMTKILDYGMDLQKAIDSSRWIIPFSIYEKATKICFEPGIDWASDPLKNVVKQKGLALENFDSYSSMTGHAQAITFSDTALQGAADPRGDGAAVGF